MMKLLHSTMLISLFFLIGSCGVQDADLAEGFLIRPGDIIISDNGTNSVYHYDSSGAFKSILFTTQPSEDCYGIGWNHLSKEIYVAVNGSDRVSAIRAIDKSIISPVIGAPQLAGVLRSVATLTDGETVVLESNTVERFDSANNRVTSSLWPQIGVGTNPYDINPLASGGYLISFFTTQTLVAYNQDTTLIGATFSGIAGTTRNYGSVELPNGNIATVWNGTTDSMVIYSPDLNTEIIRYSNLSIMTDPRAITLAENGNLLIADANFGHVIEVTQDAQFVRTFRMLGNSPWDILVIPQF